MKILGLRVREVGSFRLAVALEGLTGGLDVLAGPNEFGKSTLFRALEAAFSMPHTTKAATARDWMVPATGGAPTIEVDFDIAGAGYRLRKRFFTGARASLQKLDGSLLLRGADAEAQLSDLLGQAGGHERLGLLWVGQRKSLEPLRLADSMRDGLKGLIADEVANAVGGGAMDAIRRKVTERLAALVTLKQRKPVGAHKEASDLFASLARDATGQREAVARGRERLERLGDLRDQHTTLSDSTKRRERSDGTAAARTALESARAAADKRRTAEALWQRLDGERIAAARALADFDRQAEDLSRLTARREALAADQAACAVAAASLAMALAEARRAADEASARERAAREMLDAARRDASAKTERAESEALHNRLADVEALSVQLAEVAKRVAQWPLLAPLRQRAETLRHGIEALEARRAALSVRVRIVYDKGGNGKIARDGAAISQDAEFAVDQPTDLSVSGVGRITIAPAVVEDAGAVAAELGKSKLALTELLTPLGADSLAQLIEFSEAQSAAIGERDRLSARLDGLCPEGLPAFRARVAQHGATGVGLRAEPDASPTGSAVAALTQPTVLSLEDSLRSTEHARALATAAVVKLQAEQQTLDISVAKLTAESAVLDERHASLLSLRPANETTTDHRATLLSASQTAAERAREAVLALQAAREKEPNPQGLFALDADLTTAITAEAQAATDTNRLDKDMAGLESLLERDALDGIVEKLAETEEALAIVARTLARTKAEIAALDMLEAHLADAERDTRAKYLAPVTARLAPYLGLVLPGAELDLGEAFDATGLQRDGRSEAIARLSDGTREQIAVLARLGLGRLLADTGYPLPLILDDALVYSDDARISASFAALDMASTHHQVIVLTCRAKAFEQLGGARLMLQPWKITDE